MTNNSVRKALLNRELSFGSWIQLGDSGIAEILSNAGFQWLAVDCEHTDISVNGFTSVIRGMQGRNVVPMARVRENNTLAIRQVLDMGAQGIIVPLVNSVEDAKKAISAAKFPPEGIRGFSFCRTNDWGADFDSYVKDANRDIAVVVMIESREAVENINEIVSLNGIDGVFIGPYDLSGSYGCVGELNNPLIVSAQKKVADACKTAGKSAGIHIVSPDKKSIKKAIEDGFTFIALGMDTIFLSQGSKNILKTAMEVLK